MTSGNHNKGMYKIDWSSEPPAPPQVDFSPEEEYSRAHGREDRILSFRPHPPVALPEGTVLLTNGTLRLPNGTLLLTEFPVNAENPETPVSAGSKCTKNKPKTNTSNNSEETTQEVLDCTHVLVLPRGSRVYRNGSVDTGNHKIIMTVFKKGFVPGCDGVSCHQYP